MFRACVRAATVRFSFRALTLPRVPARGPAAPATPAAGARALSSSSTGRLTAEELLAYVRRVTPTQWLREGGGVMDPAVSTGRHFLCGTNIEPALASPAAADAFLEASLPQFVPTLTSLSACFSQRMAKQQQEGGGSYPESRLIQHALPAVQSCPGGGKSSLLEAMTVLSHQRKWTEALCPDPAVRGVLNNSIPIIVAYISGPDPKPSLWDSDDEHGLALRILHSYFVTQRQSYFHQFYRVMSGAGLLSAASAIGACQLAAEELTGKKRGVLLLLDDLYRVFKYHKGSKLMSVVGGLLDALPSETFNCVLATKGSNVIDAETAASGRPVWWAPLPPMPRAAAEAAILKALQTRDPSATELPDAVKRVISNAAGHPDSLKYVMEAMLELLPRGKHVSLAALRGATLKRLNSLYKAVDVPFNEAALRGKPLPLDVPLLKVPWLRGEEDEKHSLRQLAATSYFHNTELSGGVTEAVPKLSMLRLLLFAHLSSSLWRDFSRDVKYLAGVEGEEEAALAAGKKQDIFRRVQRIHHHVTPRVEYERFVKQWMELMPYVWDREVVTPLELLHVTPTQCEAVPADSPLRARMLLSIYGDRRSESEKEQNKKKPAVVAAFSAMTTTLGGSGDTKKAACTVALVAPGADPGKGPVIIAVEARARPRLDRDLADKRRQIVSAVEGWLADGFLRRHGGPPSIVFVDASMRPQTFNATAAAQTRALVEHAALVVGSEEAGGPAPGLTSLEHLFTPTLADSARYLLEVRDRKKGKR